MLTHNPNNERIKRQYFAYLKEARRQSEASVDAAAKALARFEADTKFRDFRAFHVGQAIAFKRRLSEQNSQATGEKLSKATLHATFAHLLTGARDSAIASMKLKHVDVTAGCVHQDAREVSTKFSKTFTTYFLPVGDEIRAIVADWVTHLRDGKLWGNDDPLFPATQVIVGAARQFEPAGLKREHWSSAGPIRAIFREVFEAAGLPYFNPHSFRKTLVRLGEVLCRSPEHFKAWSQNLGHEDVLTTFYSYGEVAQHRQGEIIRTLGAQSTRDTTRAQKVASAVLRAIADADPALADSELSRYG